ncbi:MAG: ribonuclease P protein component [Alphaproteobacteria bacterium]|nr:ribonuclease P protein component [Alphaproteobacteria bacterium]MDD9919367.1 ribonuclease P protein component [Alphaproteobacteria bacterium]
MKSLASIPVVRLKKRADFVRLRQRGGKAVTKGFILQYLAQPELKEVRVGFTATKKMAKSAVVRNRAKRRLKAVVDAVMRLNPNFKCAPTDICLIARYSTCDVPFDKMVKDLKRVLKADVGAEL